MAEERNIDDIINEFSTNNYENNKTENNSFLQGMKTVKGNNQINLIDIDHYYNFYGVMSPRVDISFLSGVNEGGKSKWKSLKEAGKQKNYNNNFFVSATIEDNGSRKLLLTLFDRTFYTIQELLFSAIKCAGASSSFNDDLQENNEDDYNSIDISDSKGSKVATLDFIKQTGKNIKNNLKIRWGYNDYNPSTNETKRITNNNYFENINSPKSEGRWNDRIDEASKVIEENGARVIASGSYEDILTNSNQSAITSQEEEFFITNVKSTLTETGMKYEINAVGSDSFVLNSFKFVQMYATMEGKAKDIMTYFMNSFNKEGSILKVCWNDERKIANGNEYVRDYQTGKYIANNKEIAENALKEAQKEVDTAEKTNEVLSNTLACIEKNDGNTISSCLGGDDIRYNDVMNLGYNSSIEFNYNNTIDLIGTYMDIRDKNGIKASDHNHNGDYKSIREGGFEEAVVFTKGLCDNSIYTSTNQKDVNTLETSENYYSYPNSVKMKKSEALLIYLYGIYADCIDFNNFEINTKIKLGGLNQSQKNECYNMIEGCTAKYDNKIKRIKEEFTIMGSDIFSKDVTLKDKIKFAFDDKIIEQFYRENDLSPDNSLWNGPNYGSEIFKLEKQASLYAKEKNEATDMTFTKAVEKTFNKADTEIIEKSKEKGSKIGEIPISLISNTREFTKLKCLKENLYSNINYHSLPSSPSSDETLEENVKIDINELSKLMEEISKNSNVKLMDIINVIFLFFLKWKRNRKGTITSEFVFNFHKILRMALDKNSPISIQNTIINLRDKNLNNFLNEKIKNNKKDLYKSSSISEFNSYDKLERNDPSNEDDINWIFGINKCIEYEDKDQKNKFSEEGTFGTRTKFKVIEEGQAKYTLESLETIAKRLELLEIVLEKLYFNFPNNGDVQDFKNHIEGYTTNFPNIIRNFDKNLYLLKYGKMMEEPKDFTDFLIGITIGFPGYKGKYETARASINSSDSIFSLGRSFFLTIGGNEQTIDGYFPAYYSSNDVMLYGMENTNQEVVISGINEYKQIIEKANEIISVLKNIEDIIKEVNDFDENIVKGKFSLRLIDQNLINQVDHGVRINKLNNEKIVKVKEKYNENELLKSLNVVKEVENLFYKQDDSKENLDNISKKIKSMLENNIDILKKAREKLDYVKENFFKNYIISLELGGEESQSLFGKNGQNKRYYKSISSLFNSYVSQCPPLVEFNDKDKNNITKSDENGSISFTTVDENGDTKFVETESVESIKKMTWSKIGETSDKVPIIGFHYLRPCTPYYVRKYCWGSGNANQHCIKNVNIETSSEFGMLNSATILDTESGTQSGINSNGKKITTNFSDCFQEGVFTNAVIKANSEKQKLVDAMVNGVKKGSIEILGDPSLRFQGSIQPCAYPIYLDIKLQKDGSWSDNKNGYIKCQLSDFYVVTGITHNLSSSGYTTTLNVMSYPSLKKDLTVE